MVRTFVSKRRRRYISHLQLDSPLQKLRAQAVFETFDLSLGRVLGAAAGTLIPPDALFNQGYPSVATVNIPGRSHQSLRHGGHRGPLGM